MIGIIIIIDNNINPFEFKFLRFCVAVNGKAKIATNEEKVLIYIYIYIDTHTH